MAPELFSEGARASKQADMYAFGMVVFAVITGTKPFGRRRMVEVPALILQGGRPPRPEDPVAIGFGQGTWEFVERCWDKDPEQRPTVRNALEHFERASRNSREVDPGPKVPVHELDQPRPENSSKNLCECRFFAQCLPSDKTPARLFDYSSANSPGRFQQATYSARVLTSNGAVPVPPLPARREPNGVGRMLRFFLPSRPTLLLAEPPQGGT